MMYSLENARKILDVNGKIRSDKELREIVGANFEFDTNIDFTNLNEAEWEIADEFLDDLVSSINQSTRNDFQQVTITTNEDWEDDVISGTGVESLDDLIIHQEFEFEYNDVGYTIIFTSDNF